MKKILPSSVIAVLILSLYPAAKIHAFHKYLRIECELGPDPECCAVYSDSAGSAGPPVYTWYENYPKKGWFDDDQTTVNWTGWHCNMWAVGSGQLYNEVDNYTLEGHGTTSVGRCLVGGMGGF